MVHPHYDSAPQERVPNIGEFPTGTTITFEPSDGPSVTLTYMKQFDGNWTVNDVPSSSDSEPMPTTPPFPPEHLLPFGSTARVELEIGNMYEYVQYQQVSQAQSLEWRLVRLKPRGSDVAYLALEQEEYTFSTEPVEHEEMNFYATRLKDVVLPGAVVDGDHFAYDPSKFTSVKASFRFGLRFAKYPEKQVRVRRNSNPDAPVPTRAELAVKIARSLKAALISANGGTIPLYDESYSFDDVVLLAVGFRSKGSMRPRLAVVVPSPDLLGPMLLDS
ncbi:hypothetical protein PYCCODRAFT_1470725 [Trametes coccinea BRFM310]|uniref:Uncharacterized protein n=1 Tax=Trametes coccinea (strain BRFM310) TaxID=1353009 RepID=A0A1Y2ICP9_TRAC3|nr:hypothetical protein PYCCODRAFT_1470725 [Trametes coccinea BRFM310]